MNTKFEEALKKWAGVIVLVVVVVAIALSVHFSHKPVPALQLQPSATSTSATTTAGAPAGSASSGKGFLAANDIVGVAVPTRTNITFQDPSWSLQFTIRPEWNVNEILDNNRKLHQLELTSSQIAIFVSKDEAIGLSSDLAFTTSTRTIAGQSVEVKTYTKPSTTFAYYQLFTLNEPDGNYAFLIKSATADTSQGDAFIRSISKP